MRDIILTGDALTSKGQYEKGIIYEVDDDEFYDLAPFSDEKSMVESGISTAGISEIKSVFFNNGGR